MLLAKAAQLPAGAPMQTGNLEHPSSVRRPAEGEAGGEGGGPSEAHGAPMHGVHVPGSAQASARGIAWRVERGAEHREGRHHTELRAVRTC